MIELIFNAMVGYYGNDVRRINHFVKVYTYAKMIAKLEQVDADTQNIIEIAGLTHDIGIKLSEEKYNSAAGKYQELEGPAEAQKLLSGTGVPGKIIERVCWLIAHHHSYGENREIDLQILVEADFIVNVFEEQFTVKSIAAVKEKIFRTKSGTELLAIMYE